MASLIEETRDRTKQTICLLPLFIAPWFASVAVAQTSPQVVLHEQRAQEYLNRKDPKDAIPELKAVLITDPNNLNALANLGVLLFFQQDYSAALPYLRRAIVQKPDLSKIQALLGLTEKYLGQASNARADLEAVVPQLSEPDIRIQAGLALIEIHQASQDLSKAEGVVALLREVAPTDPRVLYVAYRIAADQAGEAMLALSLVAPDSAQIHQVMGHELERVHDMPGAIANLRKAAELNPQLPGIHYELAEALHQADDVRERTEAESQYKLALEQNPRDALSAVALGDFANSHANLPAASAYYHKAFAIDPNLPDAAIALANEEAQNGDLSDAASKLEQVVKADPTNFLAHYRLSRVYRSLGRTVDARRELDAFQQYRSMKERMRTIFTEMRQHVPTSERSEEQPK
jgi:tetratricopeptide (TPR) repeat protein